MKKLIYWVAIVSVLSFVLAVSDSYAGGAGKGGFKAIESSKLIGTPVKNSQGEILGLITELLIDSKGHVPFAVLYHGSYEKYGEEGRLTPVPFGALKCSGKGADKVAFILDMDTERLEASPFLDPTKRIDPQHAGDIYRYYGLQPYWTETEESTTSE